MALIINTRKWRRAMASYRQNWGLAKEPGFTVETAKPLGKPARALLRRIQENLHARHLLPAKFIDGTLNSATQILLIPPLSKGDKAAAYALGQQGVHESPWGSNRGSDVHRYQSSTGAYGAAWCASFFWYCWQQAGYKGATSAGAWDSTDNHGTRIPTISKAEVGDGVSFDVGDGHIGMYLSHNKSTVKTVDGNTSDQVAVRERPLSSIHSICRPN
jgi:CHAP domain